MNICIQTAHRQLSKDIDSGATYFHNWAIKNEIAISCVLLPYNSATECFASKESSFKDHEVPCGTDGIIYKCVVHPVIVSYAEVVLYVIGGQNIIYLFNMLK